MGYGYYPNYQQYMYQPNQQYVQQNQVPQMQAQLPTQANFQQPQDERIWVQGEGAAQAYLVAPNGFVRLWDSQRNIFYEKRADPTGKPYMETFEYKRKGYDIPMKETQMSDQIPDYGEVIKELRERIEALEKGAQADEQTK